MNYAENNLLRGESIIYRAQLHWAIFLAPVFWGLIFLLMIGIGASDNFYDEESIFAVALFGVVFVISLLRAIVRKVSSEYTLTNKRLIMKHGIISRRTVELMLIKCEGISVDQGILGRILGYGTLAATTGGATNRFSKIADPVVFRNRINDQIDAIHSATGK